MTTTPENVDKIREVVHEDRWRTIQDTANIVNVSYGTAQAILTSDLNMHCIAAKFVPRILTAEHKVHHVKVRQDLRQPFLDSTFMLRVTTGDETWAYGYNQRPNNSIHSGRAQHLQDRRRRGRSGA